ncbi:hypothetical protein KSF78_0008502 [Schistosoma japonicum]|nr:hypothetical protein KSF78_0008502 [Schistosoma japonicum]
MFDLKLLRRRSEPLPIIQSDRDHCQKCNHQIFLINKHPIHDAVYDSSSNFLLHCMTIDECYNKVESILNNPDAISSSPLNKEIDSETLTRATPISERGKNDTTTVIPYERIQFTKKRKNDNIPNSGIIPQEINRHKFHKYRKYVNQPLKLTTTTTRMNGTRKRPDPFA